MSDFTSQKIAQDYFINGEFKKAKALYSQLGMNLEVAYCEIYSGSFQKAKNIILDLKKENPAEEWINSFIQMIELDLVDMPTYLQIRNFFEIDLDNLFVSGKKDYAENVINMTPNLLHINPEIFKITARVLKNNEQHRLAMEFLHRSLDIYFYDSETHFMLAELYLKDDDISNARKHLGYANKDGNYFPAIKLLKAIENM